MNSKKVYLPPSHTKLGLIKSSVKAMNQKSARFIHLKRMNPGISEPKFKERVLVGPEIRELIWDVKLEDQLSELEKAAWKSLKNVTTIFLENHKAEDDRNMVPDLVQSYTTMGRNMSLKAHFLDFHLDFTPENPSGQ
jgi:hypothetical protein